MNGYETVTVASGLWAITGRVYKKGYGGDWEVDSRRSREARKRW